MRTMALMIVGEHFCSLCVGAIAPLFFAGHLRAQTPSVTNLGVLPGGKASLANAVNSDGSAVAGSSESDEGYRAFRWTAVDGMQNLGTLAGFEPVETYGNAISGDGLTVAGSSGAAWFSPAFRWTSAGGMQALGFTSFDGYKWNATGLNSDGSAMALWSFTMVGGDKPPYPVYIDAWRWTAPGLQYLNGPNTRALAINSDGTCITGESEGSRVFRWTETKGFEDIGAGTGIAISGDGSVVAGGNASHAFRWTEIEGMQDLGVLPDRAYSVSNAISGDGLIIAGKSGGSAFMWSNALGMVDLNTYLPTLGLDLAGWELTDARGLNSDGSVIVGHGTFDNEERGWIVNIPHPGDVTGNGVVDVDDLLVVINAWGLCPPESECEADIAPHPKGNGTIDVDDLLRVTNNWS